MIDKKSYKYWVIIRNDAYHTMEEADGKWIVFFPQRHFVHTTQQREIFHMINEVVNKHSLMGAVVPKNELSIAAFFTSAESKEIWRVKQIMKKELKLSNSDLIWKADFESDEDWARDKGNRWFLSGITESYDRKALYLSQGRLDKAERIQKRVIDPLLAKWEKRFLEGVIMKRKSMVITPVFSPIDYEIDPKLIFLIMPFSEDWSDDVHHLIRKTCEALRLRVIRADDIFEPDIVINDIWKMIISAGLVIADITAHNANVFYELGIAHTVGKKVVLIRQEGGAKTPFDVAFWRYFEYGLSPLKADEFEQTLTKILRRHIESYR